MDFERESETTIAEYMMMIRLKTAVLLAGALKIGALYAGASDEDVDHLYEYGIHLGLAFQLQDDLLDAYGDVAVFGKQTGQDIRDNKKTYLILKALEVAPMQEREELKKWFATTDCNDDEKVASVLKIYAGLNIKEKVEEAIETEFESARRHLDAIRVEEAQKRPLRELTEALLGRKK